MILKPDLNIERFVTADAAAEFLCMSRRRILELSRRGEIPAHPIGHGKRKQWRYKLTELADAFVAKSPVAKSGSKVSSTPAVPGNRIGGTT